MPFYPSDLPGFATCAPLPMPAHAQHASASTQLDHAFPSRMHAPLMANRYRDLNSLINIVIWRGLQVAVVLSEKVDTTLSKGILRVGGTVVGGSLGEPCFSLPASKLCPSWSRGRAPLLIHLSVGLCCSVLPFRKLLHPGISIWLHCIPCNYHLAQKARCV